MYTLEIIQDNDPENPVAVGFLISTLAMFHKRYTLGDQNHGIEWRDFESWGEMEAFIRKEKDAAVVIPIYMYDHSGLTISHTPFSCNWDAGQVGYGYITKQQCRDELNCKRVGMHARDWALRSIRADIKVYDQYLTGDVWGYVIKDQDGEEIEACWGVYGREYCETEGNEAMARLKDEHN